MKDDHVKRGADLIQRNFYYNGLNLCLKFENLSTKVMKKIELKLWIAVRNF